MKQNNLALEILVRKGSMESVKTILTKTTIDHNEKNRVIAETALYSTINFMEQSIDEGVDSDAICNYLNHPELDKYFASTNNAIILRDFVSMLYRGTQIDMESYAMISAIGVLGHKPLADAIRRNIKNPEIRMPMIGLAQTGFSLVFSPYDIDDKAVKKYFPILEKWKDMVDTQKIVREAVNDISQNDEFRDLGGRDYRKNFLYTSIDKMIELTDKKYVSKLFFHDFKDTKTYKKLIANGKLEGFEEKKTTDIIRLALDKSIREYDKDHFPSEYEVEKLSKSIKSKDEKIYLARRFVSWFEDSKTEHWKSIANYEGDICDAETVKEYLTPVISNMIESGKIEKLADALEIPEKFIDKDDRRILEFVRAHNLYRKTKS